MVNNNWYKWNSGNLQLRLQIQTRSSTEKFAEILEDRIKLRIHAAAVNGKANDAIIKFLSKEFQAPRSSIKILHGQRSTKKLVNIQNPGRLPGLPGLSSETVPELQHAT
jgi:hypothetical protein